MSQSAYCGLCLLLSQAPTLDEADAREESMNALGPGALVGGDADDGSAAPAAKADGAEADDSAILEDAEAAK